MRALTAVALTYLATAASLCIPALAQEDTEQKKFALFCAHRDGKCGFIDRTGRFVIEPRYGCVRSFSEGLAAFREAREDDPKWGYMDVSGRTVIPPRFDEARRFSQGLAAVKVGGKTYVIGEKYISDLARD